MIRLRQTKGADSGRELEFDQDLIRIGRMPDSDVNFDPEVDLDASGRHAEIRSEDGLYLLIDAGSRNGTWLNGERIKHAALNPGDEIELGRGGPKLKVKSMQGRPGRRKMSSRATGAVAGRDPRFDPLAAPGIRASQLDELEPRPGLFPASLPHSEPRRAKTRRRRRSSLMLWGAAGVILLMATAIVVGASIR